MYILGWLKKFGPTQNILEPVKGQGNRLSFSNRKKSNVNQAKKRTSMKLRCSLFFINLNLSK